MLGRGKSAVFSIVEAARGQGAAAALPGLPASAIPGSLALMDHQAQSFFAALRRPTQRR
ncbi:hypothetical protein D554_2987 [Bordetella holmesii 30539]|nr:hypothetical protein D560_3070 [Bordetella holmesii ATCC 51541]EWM42849.1 hypothetical protein D556_3045 [Bordetella holmesii 41130]EXF87717.1 hypothetical protein D554_2987 [Bordetella holmesii 30539]